MASKSTRFMAPGVILSLIGFLIGGPVEAGIGLAIGLTFGELYHRQAVLEERVETLERE